MPVPTYGGDRPTGLVEPLPDLTGVTELRVHGVGGTTPGALLGDLAPQQVAGDAVAGFYRTTDVRGRHVEAYSWGGLTSRSGTRVLWLLLLPFLLANLAGWMCSPRARRSPVFRWLVRCAALGLTLNALVITALATVDVLGYQCGTDPACGGDRWWLAPLRWDPVAGHPGRLVLVGALVPVGMLVLLAFLSYRSRSRYESVRPPVVGMPGEPGVRSAASLPDGLADPHFWDGARSTKRLGRAHTAASIGVLTVLVLHGVDAALGPAARFGAVSLALQVLALVTVAAAVALLAVEDVPDAVGAALLLGASATGLLGVLLTWLQPAAAVVPDGQLPGIRTVVNITYGGIFLVMAALLVAVVAYGQAPGSFRWGAPFVVLALAIALLNVVLLGLLVGVAELAGSVRWAIGPGPAGSVSLFPVVQAAMPYLTLVPVLFVLVFALVQGWLYWRAGRVAPAPDYPEATLPPGPLRIWQLSALDGPAGLRWRRRIARARRLAVAGTDLGYLLTAIAVAGSLIMIFAEWQLLHGQSPAPGTRLTAVGTAVAVALPAGLLWALRSGWRSLAGRRRMGVLWDVGTFWPRSFHPLAPPSYAERAVPDLQRRLWWVHDNGGRVLLAAHSQGTVLAAAALLQPGARAPGSSVALVTFGSPLGTLYRWGFPAWVGDPVLAGIPDPWVNVHYATDYIGGPAFSTPSPVDVLLPDPRTSRYVYGQPLPAVGSHSGYWRDPAMWALVDDLADGLATGLTDGSADGLARDPGNGLADRLAGAPAVGSPPGPWVPGTQEDTA